jgi:hypothetical protein
MGAEPWSYFVPFQSDVATALESLRQKEFEAGRYHKGYQGPTLAARSIEEALERSGESGTRSVLDMAGGVSDAPDFFCVCPLDTPKLISLFGTEQPTHEMVEQNQDLYEDIERGHGVFIVVYADGKPSELFFGGYSFD